MKENIHPKYNEVTATCACGASFVTGSVKGELLTFAPNATRSLPANNVMLQHVAVLKNSINVITQKNNHLHSRAQKALLCLYAELFN